MRLVMNHVALLAERHKILDPVVGLVLVDVMRHQRRPELRPISYYVNPDPLRVSAGDASIPVSVHDGLPHEIEPQRPALAVFVVRIALPRHSLGMSRRRAFFAAILDS